MKKQCAGNDKNSHCMAVMSLLERQLPSGSHENAIAVKILLFAETLNIFFICRGSLYTKWKKLYYFNAFMVVMDAVFVH
jgi:hypothetical protein